MTTPSPLDAYERLHLEATPTPFVIDVDQHAHGDPSNGPCYAISVRHGDHYIYKIDDADAGDDATARLLAQSRNIAPYVIALARAAEIATFAGSNHSLRVALVDLLRVLEEGGKDS